MFCVQVDRERLTQLFFEQFNVSALFLCDQAVLSLYALGKTSGTVIDLGHGKVGAYLPFLQRAALQPNCHLTRC